MLKVAIGIPTYKDCQRIRNLIASIYTFTDFNQSEFRIVMLDDGTPEEHSYFVDELKELSKYYNIPLIINDKNYGIPYAWNRLTEYYDAEYVMLFNDDVQVCNSNWLKCAVYFLDNNKQAANIGFPLIHIDPKTGKKNEQHPLPDETCDPGRVGAPVGCAFMFRKEIWSRVEQPLQSTPGFPEFFSSFHEETDFGFSVYKLGYHCYMIPFPAVEHWGSQSFANNSELSFREIIDYLPKEEYLDTLKKCQRPLAIPFETHQKIAEQYNKAFRMDYSRMLLAKKWGCKDYWDVPQNEIHERFVYPVQPMNIKWLDNTMNIREKVL